MLGGFHFNLKKYHGHLSIRRRERRQRQVSGEPQVRKQVSCRPCPGGPAERVSPAAKNGKLRQNNEGILFVFQIGTRFLQIILNLGMSIGKGHSHTLPVEYKLV